MSDKTGNLYFMHLKDYDRLIIKKLNYGDKHANNNDLDTINDLHRTCREVRPT